LRAEAVAATVAAAAAAAGLPLRFLGDSGAL
jgi:hypothetical protein